MEIKIIIPANLEQRVLDGHEVDNAADLKIVVIQNMKQTVLQREYKQRLRTAQDNAKLLPI